MGKPAVSGAVSVALGDRKTAIDEVLLGRVADRPSAFDIAALREPYPPHFPHLGRGEKP